LPGTFLELKRQFVYYRTLHGKRIPAGKLNADLIAVAIAETVRQQAFGRNGFSAVQ
jgi:hypothetical protein